MTSIMLAQRLCRNLRTTTIAELPMAEVGRVVDAMNEGITEWFEKAPARRKQSPYSEFLKTPVTINVTVTAGEKTFSYTGGTPFPISGSYAAETAIIGLSCIVTGDTMVNRINRAGEFLRPYTGSTGDMTMTVYCDAVLFDYLSTKIVGDPIFRSAGVTNDRPLIKAVEQDFVWRNRQEMGYPRFWWTQPLNPADHTTKPTWLLRMWPLPTTSGTVTATVEAMPVAYTVEDVVTARNIPIPANEMSEAIRLCEERMLTSPSWNPAVDKNQVVRLIAQARAALTDKWSPMDTGPTRIGTPRGW